MRRFEAHCWIPRGVEQPLGPLDVYVREQTYTVHLKGAKRATADGDKSSGAEVTIRFDLEEQALSDDEGVYHLALDVGVTVINRVVHVAAFLGNNQKVIATLQDRDLQEMEVFEVTGRERKLQGTAPRRRPIRVKGQDIGRRAQEILHAQKHGPVAEALWLDALEAAYDGRPREAVVAGSAAMEVAWRDAARSVVESYRDGAHPSVSVFLAAYLDEALTGRTTMHERLDRFSRALLGKSFKDHWGTDRWSKVMDAFTVRNIGAHGHGEVTDAEARKVVVIARDVLDDVAAARASVTTQDV